MQIIATAYTREDGLDIQRHSGPKGTGWILRAPSGPMRFYNFDTQKWDYAHLIVGDDNRSWIPYLRDKDTAMTHLIRVEKPE